MLAWNLLIFIFLPSDLAAVCAQVNCLLLRVEKRKEKCLDPFMVMELNCQSVISLHFQHWLQTQ